MKTLGLIGGMSWESTVPYYRQINQQINQRLGGLHSAKIILYSVDFQQIEALQRSGDWQQAGRILAEAAQAMPFSKRIILYRPREMLSGQSRLQRTSTSSPRK